MVETAASGGRGEPLVSATVRHAFSVDVEEYFHVHAFDDFIDRAEWDGLESRVVESTDRVLDLLDRHGTFGTFFTLGWVAERQPDLIRRIVAAGHEMALHGYDHRSVRSLTPDEFRDDIRRSRDILEDIGGEPVVGYRAPSYSIVRETLWALDILLEEGFLYDSSIFPIRHDRYGIPDSPRFPWRHENGEASLWEFPASTVRLAGTNVPFVGGGYLRLLPWSFIRWGMRRLEGGEGRPAMLYTHPWELDPEQPRVEVGTLTRWRHYGGLRKTESRIDRLLSEFRFGTVREVLGL